MLDDLNELKTFSSILAARSLSGAARNLGVSLSVVSKRLATLEKRVGVRLVHRTTRSLSPTEDGARLALDVERALEAISAGERRILGGRGQPAGVLRVSAPVSLGRRHIAPVIGDLAERESELSISLVLTDRILDLAAEGIDVAIRIGDPVDSSAMMRKLADNNRILVASPAYLERVGRPTTPAEVDRHAFLRYGDTVETWRLTAPDGTVVPIQARARLSVDNGDAIHDWALAGHGIMLKSEIDVARDLAARRLERVLPNWSGGSAPVIALYQSARHMPLKTSAFLNAVAKHLGQVRP